MLDIGTSANNVCIFISHKNIQWGDIFLLLCIWINVGDRIRSISRREISKTVADLPDKQLD